MNVIKKISIFMYYLNFYEYSIYSLINFLNSSFFIFINFSFLSIKSTAILFSSANLNPFSLPIAIKAVAHPSAFVVLLETTVTDFVLWAMGLPVLGFIICENFFPFLIKKIFIISRRGDAFVGYVYNLFN